MSYRCKMGNPKKKSRFICIQCLKVNQLGEGIQRMGKQREKGHIKDLFCLQCKEDTKNLEVRYCDIFDEMMGEAEKLHDVYYGKVS